MELVFKSIVINDKGGGSCKLFSTSNLPYLTRPHAGRRAEKLKVDCLRAVGRQAEADQLTKQVLAAWPEMGAVRRFFRFLGMVATEGKRLFVIATNKKDSGQG